MPFFYPKPQVCNLVNHKLRHPARARGHALWIHFLRIPKHVRETTNDMEDRLAKDAFGPTIHHRNDVAITSLECPTVAELLLSRYSATDICKLLDNKWQFRYNIFAVSFPEYLLHVIYLLFIFSSVLDTSRVLRVTNNKPTFTLYCIG